MLVDNAEFPQRLLHLLRNPAYLLLIAAYVCMTYTVMGVFANMVRYLEIVFLQQASVANVIQGLSTQLIVIVNKTTSVIGQQSCCILYKILNYTDYSPTECLITA